MPRGRRAASKPLSLGFAGSGELDPKTITALLDDLVGDSKPEAFYVPVTAEDFTEEVEAVVKWAVDNEVPYTTISDEAAGKDKALAKVIKAAADDYDAGESAGKAIVELLAGDETDPVEDGRLLMFFDGDEDEDVAVFEEAHDLEVAAFDLRDGLSPMSFGDDEAGDPEPEPEPEPEEAPSRRRGRRGAAAEPEAAQEPDEAPAAAEEPPTSDELRMELSKLTLVELKKRAKALPGGEYDTDALRGLDKGQVIDILLDAGGVDDEGPADEAQQAPTRRGRAKSTAATASEAVAPAEAGDEPVEDERVDSEAETREAVFARLRGQREEAERITRTIVKVTSTLIDEASEEGGDERAFEVAAAAVAGALMVFADFIVTEVRKPKSAGRPRKDGTEAQPAANPRRRRASS